MNINGKNCLACITNIEEPGTLGHRVDHLSAIEVRPIPGCSIIKDLVPDLTNFYNQYKSIQPWLQRKEARKSTQGEILQSEDQRAKLDGLYECILCACCTTSCPSAWWNPDAFRGPAALLQAYRWLSDSRDENAMERLQELNDTMKLYRCHHIGNCTACCPKGLDPSKAIGQIKKMQSKMLTEW
eukprot:Filipodium_phascolosomae@DN793_c0_g1_i2.p1